MALFDSPFAAVAQPIGMVLSDGRRTSSSVAARKRQASVNSAPPPRGRGSKAATKTKAASKPKPKGPQRACARPAPRRHAGISRNVCDTRMLLHTGQGLLLHMGSAGCRRVLGSGLGDQVPRGLRAAHRALTRALPSRLEGKRSTALVQKLTKPKARPPRALFATPESLIQNQRGIPLL